MIKKLHIKEDAEIEVKNTGVLEVPENKNVDELPIKHFVALANKKGLSTVTRALNNLQVWNKNKDPKLSKWAGDMIDKVTKRIENQEKNESLKRESALDNTTEPYGRYMVKFVPYKNMYKFDYIDNYSDASKYCFFDNRGYVNTEYSGIRKQLFDKLYDKGMKPNRVYMIYTDTPHGDVLYYKEVPSNWFHL